MNKRNLPAACVVLLGLYGIHGLERASSQQPPQLATPAQRLMMEQVSELQSAGEIEEALGLLEKLHDEAQGRIVPAGSEQAASTLKTQRFIPLSRWTGVATLELLKDLPQEAERYRSRQRESARSSLEEHRMDKDVLATQRAARRYYASEFGSELHLLLCDLYLENGWGLAALQAVQDVSPLLRFDLQPEVHTGLDGSLPWSFVWRNATAADKAAELAEVWEQSFKEAAQFEPANAERLLVSAVTRMLIASAINPRELDLTAAQTWAKSLIPALSEMGAQAVDKTVAEVAGWSQLSPTESATDSFMQPMGATAGEVRIGQTIWPVWTQSLERYSAGSDRLAASKPRVGESERGTLPYFPCVKDGRVYLNELTRIVAYDLQTGQPWPDIRPPLPLFDSRISPAAYLPLGYPLVGTPRGTLQIVDECLYARMGSPISGRINPRSPSETDSLSYIVGLDLGKQGSLLPGFPLRLDASEWMNAEFDGPPQIWGELLLVAVAERDNVGIRRRVVAFDRLSGQLIWKSEVLAIGSIEGSDRANLISHQMLTLAGGRLYYNTNLGVIACLNPLSGETEWLVSYSRPASAQAYPRPDRFRYRDLTPCIVSGGLVYCAPQDTPEVFALDTTSGDLVWSTDDNQAADAIHMLGVHEDCLILSGDRLVWLDRLNGQVRGRFPAGTTPGTANGLPNPRGLGRGQIAGGRVFWPVAGEIFVFPANLRSGPQQVDRPPISERIVVGTRGTEGGNLLFSDGWMFITSPSWLMAFEVNSGHNVSERNLR
jgi:outer membrane protein assembly factor BamB